MHTSQTCGRVARVLGNALAALVLLGAPVGAVAALKPWQAPSTTSAPWIEDDAVAGGLNIVEPPIVAVDGTRPKYAAPVTTQLETIVRGWIYTAKPPPSPSM